MKRSVKLEFTGNGKLLLQTDQEAANEQSMVRAVALNLISKKGDDVIFADRGTDIGWSSFQGVVLMAAETGAAAKFAALDTLFFTRTYSSLDSKDKPEQIILEPSAIRASSVDLLLSVITVDRRTLSYNLKK